MLYQTTSRSRCKGAEATANTTATGNRGLPKSTEPTLTDQHQSRTSPLWRWAHGAIRRQRPHDREAVLVRIVILLSHFVRYRPVCSPCIIVSILVCINPNRCFRCYSAASMGVLRPPSFISRHIIFEICESSRMPVCALFDYLEQTSRAHR